MEQANELDRLKKAVSAANQGQAKAVKQAEELKKTNAQLMAQVLSSYKREEIYERAQESSLPFNHILRREFTRIRFLFFSFVPFHSLYSFLVDNSVVVYSLPNSFFTFYFSSRAASISSSSVSSPPLSYRCSSSKSPWRLPRLPPKPRASESAKPPRRSSRPRCKRPAEKWTNSPRA